MGSNLSKFSRFFTSSVTSSAQRSARGVGLASRCVLIGACFLPATGALAQSAAPAPVIFDQNIAPVSHTFGDSFATRPPKVAPPTQLPPGQSTDILQSGQTAGAVIAPRQSNQPILPPRTSPNRRGLLNQGRMVTAGFGRPFRQQDDQGDSLPDPFGENQSRPAPPKNDSTPAPRQPGAATVVSPQDSGELPPDIFADPFKNERRNDGTMPNRQPSIEIPNTTEPAPKGLTPEYDLPDVNPRQPKDARTPANPFERPAPDADQEEPIDYQPSNGFGGVRSQSNVYRPPTSPPYQTPGAYPTPALDGGPYYVPAYEAIPGTEQPLVALPMESPQSVLQSPTPRLFQPVVPSNVAAPANQVYSTEHASIASEQLSADCQTCDYGSGCSTPARRLSLFNKVKRDLLDDLCFDDQGYQACEQSCNPCDACPVFYFGFQGGWNDATDVVSRRGSELETGSGSAFMFALGRMNGRNLRTEVELSFRDNPFESLLTPTARTDVSGDLRTFSGMANAYWEFVDFPSGRLKPYVGGGVGFTSMTTTLLDAGGNSLLDDNAGNSSSFAYQWMAGLNYKFNNNLDLYGEYRFLDVDSFRLDSSADSVTGNFDYSAASIGAGLRLKF
jgi:opacity protein-like surface antigen